MVKICVSKRSVKLLRQQTKINASQRSQYFTDLNANASVFFHLRCLVVGTGKAYFVVVYGAKSHNAIIIILLAKILINDFGPVDIHSLQWWLKIHASVLYPLPFIDYTIKDFWGEQKPEQIFIYFKQCKICCSFSMYWIHCFWLRFVLTSDIILKQITP